MIYSSSTHRSRWTVQADNHSAPIQIMVVQLDRLRISRHLKGNNDIIQVNIGPCLIMISGYKWLDRIISDCIVSYYRKIPHPIHSHYIPSVNMDDTI
jgi:hypothetical protein